MLRTVLMVALVLVLGIGAFTYRTLRDAGAFITLEPHVDGVCEHVPGVVGSEDVTIHPRTRIAYISSSDRRSAVAGRPHPGGIYAYDLDRRTSGFENLTPDRGLDFQPHGISLVVGADGRETLFVVNHPGLAGREPAHTIEVFDLVNGALRHRKSIRDAEHLIMPNDIVGVDAERFYLTNTHANPPGAAQTVETYLKLSGARVVFFDGHAFRTAIEDLTFPNGINLSADGRSLYVAAMTLRSLRVYDRDPVNEALSFRDEIFVGSGLDNVEVDAGGALWIGAHPQLLKVGPHGADPANRSPSQVVRVDPASGAVREVYLDEGEFSGSSVAAVRGRRLLVGQIFDDGILDCTLSTAE
jgi:arylesterase/paraoxonase